MNCRQDITHIDTHTHTHTGAHTHTHTSSGLKRREATASERWRAVSSERGRCPFRAGPYTERAPGTATTLIAFLFPPRCQPRRWSGPGASRTPLAAGGGGKSNGRPKINTDDAEQPFCTGPFQTSSLFFLSFSLSLSLHPPPSQSAPPQFLLLLLLLLTCLDFFAAHKGQSLRNTRGFRHRHVRTIQPPSLNNQINQTEAEKIHLNPKFSLYLLLFLLFLLFLLLLLHFSLPSRERRKKSQQQHHHQQHQQQQKHQIDTIRKEPRFSRHI